MRPEVMAGLTAAALLAFAQAARAEDNQAGLPLAPSDAAGPWTLASGGRDLCVITLTARKTRGGAYAANAPATCGADLPSAVAGWQPTADGMQLVGAHGARVIGFNRWSNSLFVSHRASGVDLQLRRGRGPAG